VNELFVLAAQNNDLYVLAAQNTVVAFVLALCVYGVTRVWRNPPIAHVLWLLVLIKLVAPPVMRVDWSALLPPGSAYTGGRTSAAVSRTGGQPANRDPRKFHVTRGTDRPLGETHSDFFDRPSDRTAAPAVTTSVFHGDFAEGVRLGWNDGRPILFWLWLGGAVLCALVVARRIVRFERLLRDTLPASERLERLAFEIAGQLGVRRVPAVRYVDSVEVPLLWCAGRRPTIVLPMRLFRQLDDQQAAMILAHELAHLKRRDHWVRGVELIVSTVYWWNPLVWLIRRQIHQAEDLCCDAWVRWAFPDCTKRYAEVVLQAAESLNSSPAGARLLPASPFLRSRSLKARIEMILHSRFAPSLSARSIVAVALLALIALPSFAQSTKTDERKDPNHPGQVSDQRPRPAPALSNKSKTPAVAAPSSQPAPIADKSVNSEFPYAVRFEQGATRFLKGDKITIVEVRGTADTFRPGNIYWIKGTYTLASHDRAMLLASVTATESGDGHGSSLKVQTTTATKGDGTFMLFLPMSCRGWPHISFYPADGGGDFGGNYFGTGNSVLKHWWGEGHVGAKVGAERQDASFWPAEADGDPLSKRLWDVLGLHVLQVSRGDARLNAYISSDEESLRIHYDGGLQVVSVRPNSPADRGSIQQNDVLISLGTSPTREMDQIRSVLDQFQADKARPTKMRYLIVRAGKPMNGDLTLAQQR
jgi:beta-lactamase regulating signal transducer with metallopeptidase domain